MKKKKERYRKRILWGIGLWVVAFFYMVWLASTGGVAKHPSPWFSIVAIVATGYMITSGVIAGVISTR